MKNCLKRFIWIGALLVLAAPVAAQDSPSAKATRKRLQQKISVEWKEVGLKVITEDIKRELDRPISFKIDNTTGLSNNSKLTYKADDKTVEEILNGLSDKGEFGWFVKADPKDRTDGWVILRRYKDKERGYETGKTPAKGTSWLPRRQDLWPTARLQASREFHGLARWFKN
jgi:hypothetical protein